MRADPLLGVLYSRDGEDLYTREQFKTLIDPLRDHEADRLIQAEGNAAGMGEIFHWIGIAAVVTGVVGVLRTTGDQRDIFWGVGAGGVFSFSLGNIFAADAKADRFNAVQRYNRFAHGEEEILPKPAEDEKTLLNMDSLTMPATPTPASK